MGWKNEFEEMIIRMAAAAFSPAEISYALGIDHTTFDTWMHDDEHPASIAFFKGFYSSELTVRESVFMLARSGSSPAQTLAIKLIDETRKKIKRAGYTKEEI